MSSSGRRPLLRRLAITLSLLLPCLKQVSDAFVFGVPASKLAACREHGAAASRATRFEASCQLPPSDYSGERRTEELYRQRYRGQVSCRAAGNAVMEPVVDTHTKFIGTRMVPAWPWRVSHSALAFFYQPSRTAV